MKKKFTAGPWQAKPEEFNRPYIRIRGVNLGGRYKIANIIGEWGNSTLDDLADEVRANARLIEVSPEMFEVIEMVADGNFNQAECIEKAEAIIKRVRA